MRTGAAYIRVSTEDQLEFSPDSQKKKIAEYAASHRIHLPEEYIFLDEGISGRYAKKRPAFLRMIGTAKQKPQPFEVILVWKYSRFARNRQESILYKSMLRKECGIEVVSITEQLTDDPTAILIEALLEAMDEYYSINLAQEVKRGMNEKFSRGGVVSIPPFGYRMGEKHFEVIGEQAEIVRMIYEEFLQGKGYRQIAARLNELGICTNRGNPFESRTVRYILTNPTYLGKQRRKIAAKSEENKEGQIQIVPAAHEAIVTEAVFQAAEKRVQLIEQRSGIKAQTGKADFMLRGLVRCSACGATLTQSRKGYALQCHRYTKGQCRESHAVTIAGLNQAVLRQISADWGELPLSVTAVPRMSRSSSAEELGIEQERKKLVRIQAAYEAGIDTLAEYQEKKKGCRKRIQELEARRKKQQQTEQGAEEQTPPRNMGELVKLLHCRKFTETAKNEILRGFIKKIIFDRKRDEITIYYYV